MDVLKNSLDIEASRTATPLTTKLFDVVDGFRYPELLIMDDMARQETPPEIPRIKVWDLGAHGKKSAVEAALFDGLGLSPKATYKVDRPLSNQNPHFPSYENHLNLKYEELPELLRRYRGQTRKNALKVGDFGCGRGRAFKDICSLPDVDEKNSFGVTMHPISTVRPEVQNRVVQANIAHLKPNHADPDDVRVDVFISVHGVIQYHPLNSKHAPYKRGFGLLHAINMTAIGGLIMTEDNRETSTVLRKMYELGIIEVPKEFARHFLETGCVYSQCVKVKRRPTLQEQKGFLGITGNVYELAYNQPST
jgi:hypothetical protein